MAATTAGPAGRRRRRIPASPWLRLMLFGAAALLFLAGYYGGNRYKSHDLSGVSAAVLLRPPPTLDELAPGLQLGGDRAIDGRWLLLSPLAADAADRSGRLAWLTRLHNRLAEHPGLPDALLLVLLSSRPFADASAESGKSPAHPSSFLIEATLPLDRLQPLLGPPGDARRAGPLYLVDPRRRTLAVFTADRDPATIARDIALIRQAAPAP